MYVECVDLDLSCYNANKSCFGYRGTYCNTESEILA